MRDGRILPGAMEMNEVNLTDDWRRLHDQVNIRLPRWIILQQDLAPVLVEQEALREIPDHYRINLQSTCNMVDWNKKVHSSR